MSHENLLSDSLQDHCDTEEKKEVALFLRSLSCALRLHDKLLTFGGLEIRLIGPEYQSMALSREILAGIISQGRIAVSEDIMLKSRINHKSNSEGKPR